MTDDQKMKRFIEIKDRVSEIINELDKMRDELSWLESDIAWSHVRSEDGNHQGCWRGADDD